MGLDENKQRCGVGRGSYGNCEAQTLGKGRGRLFQVPAQPLTLQFAHDTAAPKPGFPEWTDFISIRD